MRMDAQGFLQPFVDKGKCIHCKRCEAVCPVLHPYSAREPLSVFAAKATDESVVAGSASGGAFTLLASHVIGQGGVVFGAGFKYPEAKVEHMEATSLAELEKLRGSKYSQSDMGDTFQRVKIMLESGRNVLFSGCPCQVSGLKHYLGKDYDNLLTMDLICHGVPSPLVWNDFLREYERKNGARVLKVQSRQYCSWRSYGLTLRFSNGKGPCHVESNDNPFLYGFLRNFYLRDSCCHCPARHLKSGADLTVGDFWDTSSLTTIVDDNTGVSAIIVNTGKGEGAICSVASQMIIEKSSFSTICKINPTIQSNYKKSIFSVMFFRKLKSDGFCKAIADIKSIFDFFHKCHVVLWWVKRLVVNGEVNPL